MRSTNLIEGIMSLASGFIYAGVPSVLLTLWSVNDRSIAMIMKNFYQYLSMREEKSMAIRHAQLDYLAGADQITAHPFYWAGFIAIGNNNPVMGSNHFLKRGLPLAVVLLLILGLGWWLIDGKKSSAAGKDE